MGELGLYSVGFYVWWIFLNGFLCFFEMLFLQNLTGVRKKAHALALLCVNCVITFLVMYLQSSGMSRLILHTGVIFCFAVFSMKLKVFEAIAPVAVVLTLYTFMEGFQAVFMSRLVQKTMSEQMGIAVQLAVTGILAVLTAVGLWVISGGLAHLREEKESSYLYLLNHLDEAKRRNERYRAFQHDIDNHLLILSGLVHEKRYAEAEHYSRSLSSRSDKLTVGVDTGNLAADILLKEKISFAKERGIQVNCDAYFSKSFYIEDADLCTLLANAMDNAVQACMKRARKKAEITVKAGMKQHFLFINVTNTDEPSGQPTVSGSGGGRQTMFCEKDYGTGLKNIKQTVKKYEGTMAAERVQGRFSLSMLLCLKPSAKGE